MTRVIWTTGAQPSARQPTNQPSSLFSGGPISLYSHRQYCVASSTTESKFISTADGTKEAIWLRRLHVKFGGSDQPVKLNYDNQGALVRNPVFYQSTKHMDDIQCVETELQLTDCFTKALAVPGFDQLRSSLNITELKEE